ncbi:hypothetical protein LINPERPRIM_LOCUS18912 [Linum perenne]
MREPINDHTEFGEIIRDCRELLKHILDSTVFVARRSGNGVAPAIACRSISKPQTYTREGLWTSC